MTIPSPQRDLPRSLSGGADVWDNGLAGQLLSDDFFTAPVVEPPGTGSLIKYWNGTAWVSKPLKRWNGTAWTVGTLKRWNGTAWITV